MFFSLIDLLRLEEEEEKLGRVYGIKKGKRAGKKTVETSSAAYIALTDPFLRTRFGSKETLWLLLQLFAPPELLP